MLRPFLYQTAFRTFWYLLQWVITCIQMYSNVFLIEIIRFDQALFLILHASLTLL